VDEAASERLREISFCIGRWERFIESPCRLRMECGTRDALP
jgi:hypothetical protein